MSLAPAPVLPPRFLYLHGFASGPRSTKGLALEAHFAKAGVALDRIDLRVPSLEHLRLSEMLRVTAEAIGGAADRAVVFGSSLGGLCAARLAERDARVAALVLLAPAFRLAERWEARLGEAHRRWREAGFLEVDDHATKQRARVDYGFFEDARAVDADPGGWPDVRVPTLVLHGRADDVVDVELSRVWSRGKRHVHLVELDDGHELVASLPRIAAAAEAFLAPFLSPVSPRG